MPTLSGIYTSLTGQTLAIDEHGHLRIIDNDKQKTKLRADAEFWLCEDDGVRPLPIDPHRPWRTVY